MKRILLIGIGAILIAVWGVSVYSYTKTRDIEREHEAQQSAQLAKSKYEVGPPDAHELLELVNAERAKVNVKPLVLDERISASAQKKADDMRSNRYFDHVSPVTGKHGYENLKDEGLQCSKGGENLIKLGNNTSYTAIEGWKSSKPHYLGMIDPNVTATGFGFAGIYTVEHFCNL